MRSWWVRMCGVVWTPVAAFPPRWAVLELRGAGGWYRLGGEGEARMWSKIRVPGWRGAGLAVIATIAGVVVAPGPVGSAAADTRPAAVSCYYICDGTDPN